MSSNIPEAVESMESSAEIDVEGIIETTFQLGGITSEFAEDELNEERERRIVARTIVIRLFRRSGFVEKVLRKSRAILEQDLVKHEGESEGSWVLIRNQTVPLCAFLVSRS